MSNYILTKEGFVIKTYDDKTNCTSCTGKTGHARRSCKVTCSQLPMTAEVCNKYNNGKFIDGACRGDDSKGFQCTIL